MAEQEFPMSLDEVRAHRIEPDSAFTDQFPEWRDAKLYEFDNEGDAILAKSLMLAVALKTAPARIVQVKWADKFRLVALG